MLNGMLSSFRPSKRLAEAPEPLSGPFSIMVCSQMANPENATWLIRDAGSIDALIMGSRSASYSGRLTGLLASLRRAYLGTRAFVSSSDAARGTKNSTRIVLRVIAVLALTYPSRDDHLLLSRRIRI